jgi:hypothetical protein
MKAYIVIAIIAIALWWEYSHRLEKARRQQRPPGVTRITGSGVRQATQFSGSGSASPGSGVLPVQPSMATTWGITGGAGPGFTGPSYLPAPAATGRR